MADWFEEWFGEEYLHLYPHRNEVEARLLVELLCREIPWNHGWRVLDVACGAGRHMLALEAAGARPFGLDLSRSLLARAREVTRRPLLRADMRSLPVRPGTMDLTLNLFTSFGYFSDDGQHHRALAEMISTLRPGGWFVMDFLYSDQVRANLIAAEETNLADTPVSIRRRITEDQRFVIKTILTGDGREFQERVRLFGPDELTTMIRQAGADPLRRFGDYAGAALGQGSRTIILARRPA